MLIALQCWQSLDKTLEASLKWREAFVLNHQYKGFAMYKICEVAFINTWAKALLIKAHYVACWPENVINSIGLIIQFR